MQPARRILCYLLFLLSLSISHLHSFPLQVLPSIPGYIPVYIRHGDQPLEEINPALAEAFHEPTALSKNIHLDNISNSPDINPEEDEANKYNVYPAHVTREANSNRVTVEREGEKLSDDVSDAKGADFVGNRDKERNRGKRRRKIAPKPVVKVNPLSEEEKEALAKTKIEAEDANISNVMRNSNSNRNEGMGEIDSEAEFDSSLAENSPKSEQKIEEPTKQQPLANVLSNVMKLTPPPEISKEIEGVGNQSLDEKSD